VIKDTFIINKQTSENLAHKEMISPILAGLHSYAKECDLYFKDINQKDECIIGDKKVRIYTGDMMSDEDMIIYEAYYSKHPEIDLYICCKVKTNELWYVGFVEKEVVENTRMVQMIGQDSDKESSVIRRIFAEQYKNLNEIFKIEEEEKEEEIIEKQNHIPLHTHSEWSVGDGFGSCKYIAENLYKKGFTAAALTDHGTLAGVWEFQKACLEKGVKPICGYEAYLKIPQLERRTHITLLVKNGKGWKNILKLHDYAVREGFYYKPTITFENLLEFGEGLVVMSGCMSGIFYNLINENKTIIAEGYLDRLKERFGDDLYGEIGIHNIKNFRKIMEQFYEMCASRNIKCVLSTDSHYPNKEEIEIHKALKAISMKKKHEEAGFDDDCFYLMRDKEIDEKIKDSEFLKRIICELKKTTIEITNKIEFSISPPDTLDTLPKFLPTIEERKEKLKELCLKGLKENTPYEYKEEIKEQLDLEVDRILRKNYENYFLIVWDLIKFAKENNIFVGPGRGSVGASLAAYALNITECDPIKFNLLFDRFLSEIRRDMPDVDMDFQDSRRHEIFEYLINKYGVKNCAKIATYSRFHPKGILRDIGRIFSIPISEIEKICKLVIQRSGGDARASLGLMDTFEEFENARDFKKKYPKAAELAIKLEGHIRHKGIHAAAMVVCEEEISNFVPINKINGNIVTEWEKQPIEDMKLIKFDILGLKTLTVLSDCAKDIKRKMPNTFEDEKVYEKVFQNGETLGVFQFETVGLGKLSASLRPKEFRTLYDTTTLFRPGVLHSGQTMLYVNRHLGKDEIKYEHPLLKKITNETLGIILYQEQIMQVMNQVGGMSWATAEMARKVITKSKGKKAFEEMRAEFVRNANKLHNMEEKEGEKLYDVVSTFGCLTGDTKIYRASSNQYKKQELSIKKAYEYQSSDNFKHRKLKILSMSTDGFIRPHTIKKIYKTGKKEVFYIRTVSNKNIKASSEHRFLVNDKWKKVKDIKIGDRIKTTNLELPKKIYGKGTGKGNRKDCPRNKKGKGKTNEEKERKKELMKKYCESCQICGSDKFIELHHIGKDRNNNTEENIMLLCRKHRREYEKCSFVRYQKGYPVQDERVEEIKFSSVRETYDIEMEEAPRNFIANNFISHNSYGFNKAHAVAYSIISYWCAWIKTYYPEVFYKNILRHESDGIKIMNYLNDAEKNGIEVEYPDINYSEFGYCNKNGKIYSGFSAIKGIGEKTANKIVSGQPYIDFKDFKKRTKVGEKLLKSLVIADCFRDFKIDKEELIREGKLTDLKSAQLIIQETTLKPKIDMNKEVDFGDYDYKVIKDLSEKDSNEFGYVKGFVTDVINKDKLLRNDSLNHIHSFEQHMVYLNINDGTGNLTVQISPHVYDRYKDIVYELKGQPLSVFGRFSKDANKIYAELIEIPGKTKDIYNLKSLMDKGEKVIISSTPVVSKKGKSYYRISVSDGAEGLCFRFNKKLIPGISIKYSQQTKPFMNIIIK